MARHTRRLCISAIAFLALGMLLFVLVWNGAILLNNPSRADYPVRGVDISAWQGEIDWPTLAGQDISFAFIKATEGSTFVDRRFAYNWAEAQTTALRTGAYENCDIWIRDVTGRPQLSDNRSWTFWQYTNRERLNGYNGNEKYIDMNVFCGTEDEFDRYG